VVKRNFVRYISHEIRTPLNTVAMGLHLAMKELQKNSNINKKSIEIINDIQKSCDTSVEILNDILTYDKLEAGDLKLNMITLPIRDAIIEIVSSFDIQAIHLGINLQYKHINEKLSNVKVNIDMNKFGQVIRNVISNALKFTPSGGSMCVDISYCNTIGIQKDTESKNTIRSGQSIHSQSITMDGVSNTVKGPFVCIDITDTGSGMTEVIDLLYLL
jgi:signal transduction histidine kinase